MKNTRDNKDHVKVWVVRIFCGFLALLMVVGLAYAALGAI